MTQHDDDLIAGWLRRLPREITPPTHLERTTVDALRREGLVRPRWRATMNLASWALAASVGTVAFVAGSFYASRFMVPARVSTESRPDTIVGPSTPTGSPQAGTAMATYALMLYGGEGANDSTTEASRAGEYTAWANADHGPDASVVGGEALGMAEASLIRYTTTANVSVEVDEKLTEATQLVGYFLVFARSRDAALRLARDCPHLKYGGRVVVRKILQN